MTPARRAVVLRQIFSKQAKINKTSGSLVPVTDLRLNSLYNNENTDLTIVLEFDLPNGEIGSVPVDMPDLKRLVHEFKDWSRAWKAETQGGKLMENSRRY